MDKSRKYLTLTCAVCGETYKQQERLYKKAKWKNRCKNHRKANNKSAKCNTCCDCGVSIWRPYTRCKTCSNKARAKTRPSCVDCGIKIALHSTRCLRCHNKQQDQGKSRERTKFQNSDSWKKIRKECYERDDYICQVCNQRGGITLECHHIKAWSTFPNSRLELADLLTVCYDCHKRIHYEKHERL